MIIKRDSNYLRYVIKVPEKRVSLLKWEEGESQIVFIARCVRNLSEPAMRCLLAVPVVSAVHCCIGGRLHGIVFRLTLALTVTGFQPACIYHHCTVVAHCCVIVEKSANVRRKNNSI